MGAFLSKFIASLFAEKDVRILILGLDNAGKTSILYRMKEGTFHSTVPKVGKLKAKVWDLGGQESIRPYWRSYYQEQGAVIFVIDSCDQDRMQIAKRELMNIIEEEELKSAVVCVFANKQDRPEALKTAEIAEALGLSSIVDKKWTIIATSALTGDGLKEGFEWIFDSIYPDA